MTQDRKSRQRSRGERDGLPKKLSGEIGAGAMEKSRSAGETGCRVDSRYNISSEKRNSLRSETARVHR